MKHVYRVLATGVLLIFGAMALDAGGSLFQSLPLLVLSFALAVAGAVIAVRGVVEFFGERV